MITRYFVNCFERELCIKWDDAYKYLEKEIIDMLDGYYCEWHSTEEIADPDYKAYVENSCCEEFIMERLSETYNMWESWWVEGDEDEDGNEILSNKINNPGYISYKRALELLNHTINYCADNGNVELEIVRRDLDAIGFTNNELKWLGHDWIFGRRIVMKSCAVVFTYSFDTDSAVYLFDTQEEAIDYMMKSLEEELRIDKEENGWDSDSYVTEDKMYAKIITHFPSGDDVTEIRIANVYDS